jgi:hypothetical protein
MVALFLVIFLFAYLFFEEVIQAGFGHSVLSAFIAAFVITTIIIGASKDKF